MSFYKRFKVTPRENLYFLNPPVDKDGTKIIEVEKTKKVDENKKNKKKKSEEVEIGFADGWFFVRNGRNCKFFRAEVARRIGKKYGCFAIVDYNTISVRENGQDKTYNLDDFFKRHS